MAVAEANDGQAPDGVAALVQGGIRIDEIRCDGITQRAVFSDRRHIARIPTPLVGCVGPQEAAVRFADSQETCHTNQASRLSGHASGGRAAFGWDKSAIDQDDALACLERSHDPEARPFFSDCLDQDLPVMAKHAFCGHARIGVFRGPDRYRRGLHGSPRETFLHRGDQVPLPLQPLDLPDAQRREARGQGETESEEGGADQTPPASTGGGAMGIMFPCRWNMIHSDPKITISTMMAVNTRATSVQPPSDRVFTCRK